MKFLRKFPYWYLIAVPVLLICLGAASNQAVLVANHGKFPVMLNPAWKDAKCTLPTPESVDIDPNDAEEMAMYNKAIARIPASSCMKGGEMIDKTHSVMGPNSHLKILSDIFPIGSTIYSVGDGLLYLGFWLFGFAPLSWLALSVRKLYVSEQ